jgi:hypothetical protein
MPQRRAWLIEFCIHLSAPPGLGIVLVLSGTDNALDIFVAVFMTVYCKNFPNPFS